MESMKEQAHYYSVRAHKLTIENTKLKELIEAYEELINETNYPENCWDKELIADLRQRITELRKGLGL